MLTTALGVILFAMVLRRPSGRERQPLPAGPAGSSTAIANAVETVRAEVGQRDEVNAIDPPPWLRRMPPQQRQAGDQASLPVAHEPERFDARARRGVERRTIGYRLVRLSDGPDDLRFREVGRVDRGDEVEVIGEDGGFLKVRTPGGLEGWVPRVAIVG